MTSREQHRAEVETLLTDFAQLGAPFRRMKFILVEWMPGENRGDDRLIEGPRGYRHPMYDRDSQDLREEFEVGGVQFSNEAIPRPGGRRAYALLADAADPRPEVPPDNITGRKFRAESEPLMALLRRASWLVQHLDGPRALDRAPGDELAWLVALLDLTDPDDRFTWGHWARELWGPSPPRDGIALVVPVEASQAADVPVCHVIEDVVRASQVALRLLLQDPAAAGSTKPVSPSPSGAGGTLPGSPAGTVPCLPTLLDLAADGRRLLLGGRELVYVRRERAGEGKTKRYVNLNSAEGRLLLTLATSSASRWSGRAEAPRGLRRALAYASAAIVLQGTGKSMVLEPRPTLSTRLRAAWTMLSRGTR